MANSPTRPSLACNADWLEERLESVYSRHPGYSDKAATLFTLDLGPPEELPDALRGEKWSFVQLPLATLQQVWRGRPQGGGTGCGTGLPLQAVAQVVGGEDDCRWRLAHAVAPACALQPTPSSAPRLLQTQELKDVEAGRAFGATLDLKAVGVPLGPDTLVPGVAVYRCAGGA